MKVLLQGCLHRERKRRPTFSDLAESVKNPEAATYISRELELQAAETRSYRVLKVPDGGASFLADLAGDNPETGDTCRVVRPGQKPKGAELQPRDHSGNVGRRGHPQARARERWSLRFVG